MTEFSSEPDFSATPIESADDVVSRMLKGATFASGAKLMLPSDRELNSDEAQAFTSAFADDNGSAGIPGSREKTGQACTEEIRYEDNPLSSRFDQWTGDPTVDRQLLFHRAMDAIKQPSANPAISPSAPQEQDSQPAVETTQDITSRKIGAIRRLFKRMTE